MSELLRETAERSIRYLEGLDARSVAPTPEAVSQLVRLGGPLPDGPTDPREVLALLDEVGSPATVASAGGRYFGFVTGGSLPATLASNWLASAWDQNTVFRVASPVNGALEEITLEWLCDVLKLPKGCGGGFLTGTTMGNFTALAAARHKLLKDRGWEVESQGLFGAPPITVVVGDEVHATLLKALALLGLGRDRVIRVPVDEQGRMRADAFPELTEPSIVCIQAGNVNSGAFDPARELCAMSHETGSWVHVDGAFGIWAAAAPERAHLAEGVDDADSWATDAHKWLNVPYDSGIVFVRDSQMLREAMPMSAAYLHPGDTREPSQFTPEGSRRARAVDVWAALRSLGRSGLADLVERNCRHATRMAQGLKAGGHSVLNEVVLNQVVVSFGDAETTRRVVAAVQDDGTCWCGGTVWQGQAAMRSSFSSWATTESDVERSLEAILRVAAASS